MHLVMSRKCGTTPMRNGLNVMRGSCTRWQSKHSHPQTDRQESGFASMINKSTVTGMSVINAESIDHETCLARNGVRHIAPTAERRWAVNQMGDSIIFMGGIAVGSLITMFIMMIAIISDDIRRENKREFRQEDEDY